MHISNALARAVKRPAISFQLDSIMMDMHSTMMEHTGSADARLAIRVRRLRAERGLTLDGLAGHSGVSRSMISLIEHGQSSPTAAVLDKLAAGLGVTLASLFADEERPDASPKVRRADQTTWRDPGTGYLRRNLSPPAFPSALELVEVVLPPGTCVAYDTAARASDVDQQVWVLDGTVEVTLGEAVHALDAGDCLAMRVDRPTSFRNPADEPARYLVALAAGAAPARAGAPRRKDAR
jgi:transcriptional regulator with XRE-family HTH domain